MTQHKFRTWYEMNEAPKHERILMKMKHGIIEGCYDGKEGYGYYWTDLTWWPTHWMPLPPPPKENENENIEPF